MNIEKLIILYSTTCDSSACGSTGYCLESSSPPACDQCACSINYTSTCCKAPYDCNSPDHMKLFIHSSAAPYQTLGPGSKQTYANISSTPCGDGNVICPWKTNDPDWDYTYDRDAYDITFQCNNLCIKDNAGDFWQTNDPTFNRVRVRPYYSGGNLYSTLKDQSNQLQPYEKMIYSKRS
uniref:Uncharacterized protein n=1 Tax=Acrobeloides nanus TaxID=290746 RepID=A0A914CKQ5_9BILA